MSTDDMNHMTYIGLVRDNDVRTLQEKEATYRGSWKKAGGRSAWFMLRRNMDRLLEMMKPPERPEDFSLEGVTTVAAIVQDARNGNVTLSAGDLGVVRRNLEYLRDCWVSEDIFRRIGANPEGEDGTVLACVRDLRCYLTLVEAEMMAEGVVEAPHRTQIEIEVTVGPLQKMSPLFEEVWKPANKPDSDESVHASLTPWAVSMQWRYRKGFEPDGVLNKVFDQYWHTQAPGIWVLNDAVPAEYGLPPAVVNHLYHKVGDYHVVRIEFCPNDARDWFQRLRREANTRELNDKPIWQRLLYRWDDGQDKWIILDEHSAWVGE